MLRRTVVYTCATYYDLHLETRLSGGIESGGAGMRWAHLIRKHRRRLLLLLAVAAACFVLGAAMPLIIREGSLQAEGFKSSVYIAFRPLQCFVQ